MFEMTNDQLFSADVMGEILDCVDLYQSAAFRTLSSEFKDDVIDTIVCDKIFEKHITQFYRSHESKIYIVRESEYTHDEWKFISFHYNTFVEKLACDLIDVQDVDRVVFVKSDFIRFNKLKNHKNISKNYGKYDIQDLRFNELCETFPKNCSEFDDIKNMLVPFSSCIMDDSYESSYASCGKYLEIIWDFDHNEFCDEQLKLFNDSVVVVYGEGYSLVSAWAKYLVVIVTTDSSSIKHIAYNNNDVVKKFEIYDTFAKKNVKNFCRDNVNMITLLMRCSILTTIDDYFCGYCKSLNNIIFGNPRLTLINNYFCKENYSLVGLPNMAKITNIGNNFCSYCEAIEKIPDMPVLESMGTYFFLCSKELKKISDMPNLKSVGYGFCAECVKLVIVGSLPKLKIVENSFCLGCKSLVHIGDMQNVEKIGDRFCCNCKSLVDFPNMPKLVSVGDIFCKGCISLPKEHDMRKFCKTDIVLPCWSDDDYCDNGDNGDNGDNYN